MFSYDCACRYSKNDVKGNWFLCGNWLEEDTMAGNRDLNKAAMAKKDEFYTQLTDIEKEMRYYKAFLRVRSFSATAMIPMKAISLSILQSTSMRWD